MKYAYALAAPIALACSPASAAVEIINIQTGGFVEESGGGGGLISLGKFLDPGTYDAIFRFDDGPGGDVYAFALANPTSSEAYYEALGANGDEFRYGRTNETFRFTVSNSDRVLQIYYELQNYGIYDLNYDVILAKVPEPSTWAMLILGFGMIGYAMRNRRRSVQVSYS